MGFWEEFTSGFENVRITIEQVTGEASRLVAAILSVMQGRDGLQVEARNAWLITVANGKLSRLEMFQTHTEALEAAELPEQPQPD